MAQNRSHAVMAQRTEPLDSLDDFPTQPWGTRALVSHVLYREDVPLGLPAPRNVIAWEPAANRGHMARVLADHFGTVIASDVHDYGCGYPVRDFLWPAPELNGPDLVITNPPFRLAAEFVRRSMEVARYGCAMLVRGTWMETLERFNLFQQHPPALIAQFAERLPMVAGYVAQEASTATSYAWVVFIRGFSDTRWRHIPPCRRALEQPGDYPAWEDQARLMSDMQLLRLLDRYETDGARPPMPEAVIRAALAARAQQAEEVPA